jgi:hypothetical protein
MGFYAITVCRSQRVGLSLFVQRGNASTTAPALCSIHVSAKAGRNGDDELKQETILGLIAFVWASL